MTRLATALILLPAAAAAHPGHIAEAAGHSHGLDWAAIAAIAALACLALVLAARRG